ncbi:Protein kinase domain [Trypanosoma vivax]|nr:Protein kinase domain [Trypanosoma vivax]
MEHYVQLRVLGKGSFGSAWLVKRRSDGVQLVAKEVRLAGLRPAERESAKREIDLLRTLNHPNITRYVDHFEHRGSLYMVMEYADGGDLYSKIRGRRGTRFPEEDVLHYFSQLCLAMLYLHDKHVLHRDLKTQNVFLTSGGVVKLGDFGISTVLRNTFELKRTVCGTPYYFSPELCLNKPYNNKSDVWALGCILYELTTLTHAFDGGNMKALVQKILKGSYPPIHSSYSSSLSNLISSMLQIDPQRRPNVGQIISLPYIRDSLSSLQREMAVAHNKPSCGASEARQVKQQTPTAERRVVDALNVQEEERRRDEQARAMRQAKERQQMLQQKMEQKSRENVERLRKIREEQQRQAEADQECRKRELEARVKEQRRLVEKRAKAQALLEKQREEEWERNMREQAEEVKRKQREEERLLRDNREGDPRRVGVHANNRDSGGCLLSPVCPEVAAELYKEMRRQAALNKQRFMEEMREKPFAPPEASHKRPTAPGDQNTDKRQCKRPHSLPSMQSEDMEEARRKAYWQMRREAEENKRRFLALDAPVSPAACHQSKPPTPTPVHSVAAPPLSAQRPAKLQEIPQNGNAHPIVDSMTARPHEVLRTQQPLPLNVCMSDKASEPIPEEPVVSSTAVESCSERERREEDFSALQTVIDKALTSGVDLGHAADFNDEAFPDVDPSRFVLDGQTLVIPNVQATDPLMHRIESLRLFLEEQLGESVLMSAYRLMNNISADDDEAMQRVAEGIPEDHHKFIPVIAQLIVCEDAFNRQILQ